MKKPQQQQYPATPFTSHQAPSEKYTDAKVDNRVSTNAPSELAGSDVRISISPQDVAHFPSSTNNLPRDETTHTLYPNARPNYAVASPVLSHSTSDTFSNPPDYSEWAVTPRLHQQRWSGTTAQEDGGMRGEDRMDHNAQELMGVPRIPPTIAELP